MLPMCVQSAKALGTMGAFAKLKKKKVVKTFTYQYLICMGGYLRQKFFAKKIGLGGKEARCSELSVSRLQRSTGNESVCFV